MDTTRESLSDNHAAATLRRWIARAAAHHPDKPFVESVEQGKAMTYAQLAETTARLAAYLAARGIGANDRVAMLAHNSVEHLAAYLGVMAYGATICTIHVEMNEAYFGDILRALAPRLVLYERDEHRARHAGDTDCDWLALGDWKAEGGSGLYAELARTAGDAGAALPGAAGDDAVIFFTSGTSAKPKGVVLSFAELMSNAEPTMAAFGITGDDRILEYRSFNWASAQILSALGTVSVGATLILARKFSQSRFFDWIKDHRASVATGNPTVINMLMNGDAKVTAADLPTLRFVTSSSAPLLIEEWQRFERRFGIPVAQGYGTSETGWIAASGEAARRLGSVGKPLAYHRLDIVDGDGRPLPVGEIGYVELGDDSKRRYRYVAEDGTVRVNATGRVRTGDLGYLDGDGFLFLTGRDKDLIIRGGVNIAPVEIDGVLMQHPAVAEAATVGVADPIYGEEVVSFVVAAPGQLIDEAALLAHCRERLAAFKTPKRILFRATLPKTARGKMNRKALAESWRAEAGDEA